MLASFVLCVLGPVFCVAAYLFTLAADQYASTVGFSVLRQDASSPIELFGGIADISGSGVSDSDILYEFIMSQELVEKLDSKLNVRGMFARAEGDFIFRFDPADAVEDLHEYWGRMVRVAYDDAARLIQVRVLAFAPEDAKRIAEGIVEESDELVEALSAIAQDDTTKFARIEVDRAVERLKLARQKMTSFRSTHQMVDPSADVQGQMGLLSTLEGQLTEALIAADLLRETTRSSDPRIAQAERRVSIIQARIEAERRHLGVGSGETSGQDYATLLAEYERLAVENEFAQQTYIAALAAYDQALAEARRKSRYLAVYLQPTLAQSSQYPKRFTLVGIALFLSLSIWSIGVLVYYSIRDRR